MSTINNRYSFYIYNVCIKMKSNNRVINVNQFIFKKTASI